MSRHHWVTGEALMFHPGETPSDKPARRGEFVKLVQEGKNDELNVVEVKLHGDPFTVCVYEKQIRFNKPATNHQSPTETESEEAMPTTERLNGKQLRQLAKKHDIENWEEMSLADLRKAVAAVEATDEPTPARKAPAKTASKRTARKAAVVEPVEDDEDDDVEDEDDEPVEPAPKRGRATKAPAKATQAKKTPAKAAPAKKAAVEVADDEVPENGNPFKKGTNLFVIAEEVIRGGKRSTMVAKLKRKITIDSRGGKELDQDSEIDRRILIVGQILRNQHGFNVVRDGRGADATIVAEKP